MEIDFCRYKRRHYVGEKKAKKRLYKTLYKSPTLPLIDLYIFIYIFR